MERLQKRLKKRLMSCSLRLLRLCDCLLHSFWFVIFDFGFAGFS